MVAAASALRLTQVVPHLCSPELAVMRHHPEATAAGTDTLLRVLRISVVNQLDESHEIGNRSTTRQQMSYFVHKMACKLPAAAVLGHHE